MNVSAPQRLLGLMREHFSGVVTLRHGAAERRVQLVHGGLVLLESTRPAESFAVWLAERDQLTPMHRERVQQAVASGKRELLAVARTGSVAPADLLRAMHAHAAHWLGEALQPGADGFEAAPGESEAETPAVDALPIVLSALSRHWRPDEILQALGERATQFPTQHAGLELRARLPDDAVIGAILEACDGRTAAFGLVRAADVPAAAAATLFVLHAWGALKWSTEATPDEPIQEESPVERTPEIEIQIERADAAPQAAPAAAMARPAARKKREDDDLAAEVRALHARLGEMTLYELLGVERDTPPANVKRAYLRLAKRLHPDVLARKGLTDLKDAANAVFAEISRAQSVLSDPAERRDYDAVLDGHTAAAADQIAQAEALYLRAEVLMKAGNFAGALEFLEPAVSLWGDEADYQGALGWCLFKRNPPDLERAREHLGKATVLEPDSATWWQRLHLVSAELGDDDAAAEALTKARALGSDKA